ncbi:HDOD domain-containing protein [Thalassotalea euphylliae]|uniref:HDOD domain-containing protein n=1 Tax=Thalassotalea euphylliae TaxID=1655234 RepID=UPI00363C31E4
MKLFYVGENTKEQQTLTKMFGNGKHELAFASDHDSALEQIKSSKWSIIFISTSATGIEPEAFAEEVSTYSPTSLKILSVDEDDKEEYGNVHHQLKRPIRSQELVNILEMYIPQQRAITKKHIVDAVQNVKTLPSPPKVYMQLNALLKHDTTDSDKIAEIVGRDPALVAKVMQFVNSSAMSKGREVETISDAITKMGVDTLCCIVMTAEMFSYQPSIDDFNIEKEQLHSLSTAKLAASMVKPEMKQNALLAGLLHDLGKLVLYEINPTQTKKFFQNRLGSADNSKLEQKIFATDHCHIGGYLLHMWGFPYPVIEAIVLHHSPEKLVKKPFDVAHAVHVADTLIRERELTPAFIEAFKLEGVLDKLVARADKLRL